jgi:hypothetical protein
MSRSQVVSRKMTGRQQEANLTWPIGTKGATEHVGSAPEMAGEGRELIGAVRYCGMTRQLDIMATGLRMLRSVCASP